MHLPDFDTQEKSQRASPQISYFCINDLLSQDLSITNKCLFALPVGIQKNNVADAFETEMCLLTLSHKASECC